LLLPFFFCLRLSPPPVSPPFPYTTLFRSRGNAFVTEIAVDLVDAVEPADRQPLQVQLRRDTQIQINVQRIAPELNLKRLTVGGRSEEHTSELQSLRHLVCRLLLEKKKKKK